jgi:hypothetical protein
MCMVIYDKVLALIIFQCQLASGYYLDVVENL